MSYSNVTANVPPIGATALSPAEYEQIVTTWNQTAIDYPQQPIYQCFEAQVERTPDAIAAIFEPAMLTYQALNLRANQLAHRLRECGVGPNVRVGLCVERGLDLLVGLLGILKAGGAYVPIDPDYPPDRIALMLEDAAAPVLVSQGPIAERLAALLNAGAATVIACDRDAAIFATMSESNPAVPASLDDLAYILYTSGSTGRPKGVMIPHRALANHIWSMAREPGIAATDTVLALTSISFDIAGLEMFLALMVGAKVVIAPRSLATDGKALGALVDRHGVTLMQATPAGWRLLIESGWMGRPHLTIITGGEPLLRSLADELLTRVDQLWDLYGPTETTVYSTGGPILADGELVTIGRPVANTQTYILDDQMQPVAIGTIGELYIGGDGVALGYLNRSDLTDERFVPDLFRPGTHTKLYRTGDLARYLADGRIEYLGRIDNQVKIRGYRIELGEIESNLEQHPTVRQAVVIPRQDDPTDGPRLVAYVLGRTPVTNPPQSKELRSHLRQMLPDYMLPAAFVVLEQFPMTPSGKVDRKALPKPALGRREPEVNQAPVSDLEAQLLCLCRSRMISLSWGGIRCWWRGCAIGLSRP
jgi:amino acid adenylation domain-containing protein